MESFCNCGTVAEAAEAAEKLFAEIAGTDCPAWAYQIAIALSLISADYIANEQSNGLSREAAAAGGIIIAREARKHRKPHAEVKALVKARREYVHGGGC